MAQTPDQPSNGRHLHPGADQGNALTHDKEPEIPVPQRTEKQAEI